MSAKILQAIDAAESNLASYWHDAAAQMDSNIEAEAILEFVQEHEAELEAYGRQIACEVIRAVFLDVAARNNPEVSLTAFFVAMGFNSITCETLESIGSRYGMTKQAVSKELQYFRDKFGARILGASKSATARRISKAAQLRHYKQVKVESTNGIGFRDFFRNEPD
jgi:hypothetical protein